MPIKTYETILEAFNALSESGGNIGIPITAEKLVSQGWIPEETTFSFDKIATWINAISEPSVLIVSPETYEKFIELEQTEEYEEEQLEFCFMENIQCVSVMIKA
jgi:hypothetical protein